MSKLLTGSMIARSSDPDTLRQWGFSVHPLVNGVAAVRLMFKPAKIGDVLDWVAEWIPQIEKSCSPFRPLILVAGVNTPTAFEIAGWTTRAGRLHEARFLATIHECPPDSRREAEFKAILMMASTQGTEN